MSFELDNPQNRAAIDYKWPVTTLPSAEWLPVTAELAKDCIETAHVLARHMDEPLPDNYSVNLVMKEPEDDLNFAIVKDLKELDDPDALFDKYRKPVGMWLRLMPDDGTDHLKPVVVIDNDRESVRLDTWDAPQTVTIRDKEFTVRHQQSWRLWNYHAAKRNQGESEADTSGDYWQPQYTDRLIITEGDYKDQDIFTLLCQFDEAVASLQQPLEVEESSFFARLSDKQMQLQKIIANNVRAEIMATTGITLHTSTGRNALEEVRQVLAAVRNFVEPAGQQ